MVELFARQVGFLDACPRRFDRWVSSEPGQRQRFPEAHFRLSGAVTAACMDAHGRVDEAARRGDALDLAEALDRTPPPELGPEEAMLYPQLVDAYAEAVGDRPGRLRLGDGFSKRASGTGRFALAAKADLVFDGQDGIEVRRLLIGTPPTRDVDEPDVWPLLAALVLDARPQLTCLAVHLLPAGLPTEVVITPDEARAFAATMVPRILAALDHVGEGEARPGPYCGTCEFLYGCPAIPQAGLGDVLSLRGPE
jgi:hypothetical protein